MGKRNPSNSRRSDAGATVAPQPQPLREWLANTFGMIVAAPIIGMFAGFALLFGGIFLGIAWQVAVKPVIDSRYYASYTASTSGKIVETWAALDFQPEDLPPGKLYWERVSKISRCAVVEYSGGAADWNAPLRRAFCGMQLNFSENFRLQDWSEILQEGIPFTFLRDASGFEVQELRVSKETFDWISKHPPNDTFGFSKPLPKTALAALREQLDSPVEIAVLSWTTSVPVLPLRYAPDHPELAMPAQVVANSHAWSGFGVVLVLLLTIPGLYVWRYGIRMFFFAEPSPIVLWVLTLLPLLALPWWGEALPKIIAHANRDWATIAADMLDDVTRDSRLIASSPDDAELAHGERLVWRLNQGQYAETFGRIAFAKPDPAPTNAEEVVAALRTQAAAQVAGFTPQEQLALMQRLTQDKQNGRGRDQKVFTTAAEAIERDANADHEVHRAARRFLLFGAEYNVWDVDALEKDWAPRQNPESAGVAERARSNDAK